MSKKTKEVKDEQDNLDFAFLVVRTTDGQTQIQPAGEEHKPLTIDDVRSALAILIRNIDAEHQASVLHQFMAQAAAQMAVANGDEVRTQSGLVVPGRK